MIGNLDEEIEGLQVESDLEKNKVKELISERDKLKSELENSQAENNNLKIQLEFANETYKEELENFANRYTKYSTTQNKVDYLNQNEEERSLQGIENSKNILLYLYIFSS